MAPELKERIPMAFGAPPKELIRKTNWRGGRTYIDPTDKQEIEHPSVTTICNIVNKPQIQGARQRETRFALEDLDGIKIDEWITRNILKAADESFSKAADIGTEMHSIIEQVLDGNEGVEFDDFYVPALQAWNNWRSQYDATFLEGERALLYNEGTCSYAGTVDAIFQLPDGTYQIVDWKSGGDGSGGIYLDHAVQISAYAKALQTLTGNKTTGLVVRMIMQHPQVQFYTAKGKPKTWRDGTPKYESDRRQQKRFTGKFEFANIIPEKYLCEFNNRYYTFKFNKTNPTIQGEGYTLEGI